MEDVREFYVEAMLQNSAIRATFSPMSSEIADPWLEHIELNWVEDDESTGALLIDVSVLEAVGPSCDESAV